MDKNIGQFYSDFTIDSYSKMIESAIRYYTFIDYHNLENVDKPVIINRHDIDFSVHRALFIARLEHKLNVKSTYFINPHSEYYNPLEKNISLKLLEIQHLGHELGLHFDSHFWNISSRSDLDRYLRTDKNILENGLGINVKVFSFHNTNKFTMSCKDDFYGGLINVYSSSIFKLFKYCSDSNGYWKYERMIEIVQSKKYDKLQLLTHPVWWTEEVMTPWQKIQRATFGRSKANLELYKKTLEEFGNINVGYTNNENEI